MTALNDARAHARRKKFEAQQADAAERERQQEVCCCNTNPGECPEHEPPESFL